MTQEEKAKAYDEALKIARKSWFDNQEPGYKHYREFLESMFPELRESEDERIRKAALEGIEYLECKLGWDAIGDTDILDVKEYLEKQKEQKPANNVSKEEYVKRFKALCDAYEIKLPNREHDIYHLCDDLSKLSIDSGKQKPAEWSEEDFEKLVGDLVQDVVANERDAANYGDEKKPTSFFVKKYLERFKSLRPSWKPSKEQMDLLGKVYRLIWADPATPAEYQDGLGDFIEQLKAL